MTEGDRIRELETSDSIQLEGAQPKLFWFLQVALWLLWFVDGSRAIQSETADWMDWSKVCASVAAAVVLGAILIPRRVYGRPRIEFMDNGIYVRPRDFSVPSVINWPDIDRIEMSTSQVSIHHAERTVRMPLSSYVMVRAVKSRLGDLAQDHGVKVQGYW